MFYFFLGIILFFVPFIDVQNFLSWSLYQWMIVGIISLLFTALPLLLWNIASGILDAAPLAILFNLAAVFTVISEMVFLDLSFSWNVVIATLIILYTAYAAKKIADHSKEN